MSGITVINPTDWVDGTDEADSFTVTNEAEGVEFLDAEGGYDTLVIDRSYAAMCTVSIEDPFNGGFLYGSVYSSYYDHHLLVYNFENVQVTGTAGNDSFSLKLGSAASGLSVTFDAGTGVDSLELDLSGTLDAITLDPGSGTITTAYGSYAGFDTFVVHAGAGDDILRTGAGNDILWGGAGTNILEGGAGGDQIRSSSITDYSNGGDDADYWESDYRAVVNDLTVDIGGLVSVNGTTVAENVESISGFGGAGNDTFTVSRAGYVYLYGGVGEDTLNVGLPGDQAQEFQVYTTLDGSLLGYAKSAGAEALGFSEIERVNFVGGTLDDKFDLKGAFTADQIAFDGGSGTDSLTADFSLLDGGGTTFIAHADGTIDSNRGTFANFEAFGITGGAGDDAITTLDRQDFVDGRGGNNELHTGGGDDYLFAGHGNDILDGGAGNDTVNFVPEGAGLTVDLSNTGPQDTGQGIDTLVGIENIYGSSSDDVLTGDAGDNVFRAINGNDILAGGEGNDVLDGGYGLDVASYASATHGVTVDLTVIGPQNAQGSDTLIDVEGLIGSDYADVLIAGWSDGYLDGAGGNDELYGGGGDDTIYGGTGDDLIVGNFGNDQLDGGAGADRLYGGGDNDLFRVDTQGDVVFENAGQGIDSVFSSASYYLYDNIENLVLDEGGGDLFGVGNALANIMIGNEGSNLLIGGAGNDTLDGGDGVDSLFGQDGNDKLYGDAGIDYLVAGAGDDTLDGGTEADALYGEAGNDSLSAGSGFVTDILVGGDGNDSLFGNSGQADYDLMDGGTGNDTYYVDTGDDLTFEAAGGGTDLVYANVAGVNNGVYLYAEVENLVLLGSTAFGVGNDLDNRLTGSASANWLLGGTGNDTINGKAGGDVLFGEAGADTFVFEHGSGGDVIGDFAHGADKIDVHAFGFASFADLASHFAQVGGDGAIYLDSTTDFIVLEGVTMATLDAGDFVL